MSKFPLGRVVITARANNTVNRGAILSALQRHANGDWGTDLCETDRRENDRALRDGNRILSSFRDTAGTKFWIITEYDRSATTILLPEDY